MTPQRIQRRRVKGWKMPEGAIYVGRPTKWGNPYPLKAAHDALSALVVTVKFEEWLANDPDGREIVIAAKQELRGRDLACFCRLDEPCHADVLLRIANEGNAPKPLDADAAP